MKTGIIYYLKKYHAPFITSKPENTQAVIDCIQDNIVYGHYPQHNDETFICGKHEFSKIFSSKPSKTNISTNTGKQLQFLRNKIKAAQHKRKKRLNKIAELGKLLAGYRTIGNLTKMREYTTILSLERNLLKGENKIILDLNKQLIDFKKT